MKKLNLNELFYWLALGVAAFLVWDYFSKNGRSLFSGNSKTTQGATVSNKGVDSAVRSFENQPGSNPSVPNVIGRPADNTGLIFDSSDPRSPFYEMGHQ